MKLSGMDNEAMSSSANYNLTNASQSPIQQEAKVPLLTLRRTGVFGQSKEGTVDRAQSESRETSKEASLNY